jgi:hypothetical protein
MVTPARPCGFLCRRVIYGGMYLGATMANSFLELSSTVGVSQPTFGCRRRQHLLSRALDHIEQWFCGLRGHDQLLEFQQDRIFLRCVSCGLETPGWVIDCMRRSTALFLVFGCLIGVSVQGVAGAPAPVPAAVLPPLEQVAVDRFLLKIEKPPVAYQARRRMEASTARLDESAWMEAVTEYSPDAGFRYSIVAQGGSERIRRRVLKSVLEAEKENWARGEWLKGRLSRSNYEFNFGGRTADGMLKMQLDPRRRDSWLVEGAALLSAQSGDLVRVEGRLSKSPSFWVKWVNVRRSYAPIGGVMMPVAIESTADVRIAGISTFAMTYEYQMVDGHAVDRSPLGTSPVILPSR